MSRRDPIVRGSVSALLRRQGRRRQDDRRRVGGAAAGARGNAARRVLLLSTDPAHSLGDVFDAPVGDSAAPIRRRAAEPGGARARRGAARWPPGGFSSRARSTKSRRRSASRAPARRLAHRELMNLAPPGIDELFGVLSVVDARASYDVIVVDTAPTGHALRLLEMPEAAREWMQVLLRVLLKYRALVRPGQLAAELVEVSKSIRELIALLRDGADDAVHRRDARRRAAAARDGAPAGAPPPPPSLGAGDRRQRADAGAGPVSAVPRRRRGRAPRARRAAANLRPPVRYHRDAAGGAAAARGQRRSTAGRLEHGSVTDASRQAPTSIA